MNKVRQMMILWLSAIMFSCSTGPRNSDIYILLRTTIGDIKIRLYNQTPLHRDNFTRLVNAGFYEGISFHRVINGFMIQAGDALTKTGSSFQPDDSINTYTLPAEFNSALFHKKGALAAARQGNDINPQMRSSGTQFYIVQGNVQSESDLSLAEQQINNNIRQSYFMRFVSEITDSISETGSEISTSEIQEIAALRLYDFIYRSGPYRISEEQQKFYTSFGGTPRLDGTYTVFGEVVEGIETVDKIAAAPTDTADRPLADIKILKIKLINK